MGGGLYTITFPGNGWCVVHDTDHRGAMRRCPHMRKTGVFMATLVQQAWQQLDDQVDEIVNLTHRLGSEPATLRGVIDTGDLVQQIAVAKAKARGKAEILFLFMEPHYASVDAIAEESSRRKHYRDTGQPYISPGLSA